jgi:hypothetical protein
MTRAEYEKRVSTANAFKKLIEMPEWSIVDELLVKMSEDAAKMPLLDVPREKLQTVYDMANGRQECILLIRNAMMEWLGDLQLRPEAIDPEPVTAPTSETPA